MESRVIVYLPEQDTLAWMQQEVLGAPVYLRSLLALASAGEKQLTVIGPETMRRPLLRAWQRYALPEHQNRISYIATIAADTLDVEGEATLHGLTATRCIALHACTVVTPKWINTVLRPALAYQGELDRAGILIDRMSNIGPANGQALIAQLRDSAPHIAPEMFCRILMRADIHRLEHFLCEAIRYSATGAVAKHINKRISLPISRVLARWRISPNSITAFNMLVGLAAGIGTASVTYFGLLMGALLFQAASVLDGCDGEVAKLTYRTSKFGQLIDTISDNFALVSFFTGLIIHIYRTTGGPSGFIWGAFMLGGYATLIVMMFRFLRKHTDSSSLVTFEQQYFLPLVEARSGLLSAVARIGRPLLKKEWFTMGFLGLAVIDALPYALYISASVAWVGVGLLLILPSLPQTHAAPAAAARYKKAS